MTCQVETPTRTSKAKPSPNSAGQKGKNTVSIYFELDGLDDVADDAFKVESYKTNVSLTIASVAGLDEYAKAVNATGRENRFLVEDERRGTISSGESNAARPRFNTSCGSSRDTNPTEAVWVIRHTRWTDLNTMSSTEARLGSRRLARW